MEEKTYGDITHVFYNGNVSNRVTVTFESVDERYKSIQWRGTIEEAKELGLIGNIQTMRKQARLNTDGIITSYKIKKDSKKEQ